MVKIGDKIRILNRDGQYAKWADKTWIVSHIAHTKNEHPGFDAACAGDVLIDCEGLPVSLYSWEFEVQK